MASLTATARRWAIYAPFLLLGPLTGPLAAGFTHAVRTRRPVTACACALGMVAVWLGLPLILAAELALLAKT